MFYNHENMQYLLVKLLDDDLRSDGGVKIENMIIMMVKRITQCIKEIEVLVNLGHECLDVYVVTSAMKRGRMNIVVNRAVSVRT